MEFTKLEKKILRELFGQLYEQELIRETSMLGKDFQDWKNGKISVWDINERIHNFHKGPSQKLFVKYSTNHAPTMALFVCGAIMNGEIKAEGLPIDLAAKIKSLESLFES